MKSKYLLLLSVVALAAAELPVLYLPAGKNVTFQWDHQRSLSSPGCFYRLYYGTNLVYTFSTNDFTTVGSTNYGTNVLAVLEGKAIFTTDLRLQLTNQLSICAVEPITTPPIESDKTTNLMITKIVGEPLPPQGLRKP